MEHWGEWWASSHDERHGCRLGWKVTRQHMWVGSVPWKRIRLTVVSVLSRLDEPPGEVMHT